MCGILCAWGPEQTPIAAQAIDLMQHRGPDGSRSRKVDGLTFGFVRLAINDHSQNSMQPHKAGDLLGVFNGEVYNHRALRKTFDLQEGVASDTAVILPLFEKIGRKILDQLDGFFAGIIYDSRSGKLFTLRDSMGKKPLFLVRCGESFLLTSELKSAPKVDEFQIVPVGICEIDIKTGKFIPLTRAHTAIEPADNHDLVEAMRRSVNKRTYCTDLDRFAVFLSGGLDSSIIAALVEESPSAACAQYYFFDDPKSEDTQYAKEMLAFLNAPQSRINPVKVPDPVDLPQLISQVVYFTESYNPSIISNGVGTFALARAARRDGHKFALGGDGADEVFCGYFDPPNFGQDTTWRASRLRLLLDLQTTELRRIDGAAMAHAIEVRCPFLDKDVRAYSEGLAYEDLFGPDKTSPQLKYVLRDAFAHLLPHTIAQRRKLSFDRGTGLQKMVHARCTQSGHSEKSHLAALWRYHFGQTLGQFEHHPYFWSYPAFDPFIETRGDKYLHAPSTG